MVRKVATNPVADADRRRYLMMSAAVLIGLAGIGFMLLTSTPPEAPGPESATTDAISPGPDTDSQPPAVESPPPAIEPIVVELSESAPDPVGMEIFEPVPDPDPLAMEPVEPAPDPVAVDPTGPSAATDPVERSESPPDPTVAEAFETAPDPVAADVIEPAPDPAVVEIFEPAPESVAVGELEPAPDPAAVEIFEPVPDPVVQPPTERASTPPLAPTAGVAVAGTGEQTIDSLPNMTVAAELEQFRETTEALEAELASRDLFAAELALELGRLVEPPQESAYTLYNRVLARYPDSPEAKAGLQAVGQKLINRTLAQLAGNELDSARSSLQAAEDAGVNPQLIADLRGEIEYRQQLTGE